MFFIEVRDILFCNKVLFKPETSHKRGQDVTAQPTRQDPDIDPNSSLSDLLDFLNSLNSPSFSSMLGKRHYYKNNY